MQLYKEVIALKKLIQDQACSTQTTPDQLITIEDAAKLLKLSRYTIYSLVSKDEIPYMKQGKRLYFTSGELTAWLKSGRKDIPHRLPKFESARRTAA